MAEHHERHHRPDTGDGECSCGGWVGPMTTLPDDDPRSFAAHCREIERERMHRHGPGQTCWCGRPTEPEWEPPADAWPGHDRKWKY